MQEIEKQKRRESFIKKESSEICRIKSGKGVKYTEVI